MSGLKNSLKTLILAGGLLLAGGNLKAQEKVKQNKDSITHVLEAQKRQANILRSLKQKTILDNQTEVSYIFESLPTDRETLAVASRNHIFFAEKGKLLVGGGNEILGKLQSMGFKPIQIATNVYEISVGSNTEQQKEQLTKQLGTNQIGYKYTAYTSACPTFNDPQTYPAINQQLHISDAGWVANNFQNPITADLDSVYSKKGMHVQSTMSTPNIVVNIFDGGFDVNNTDFTGRVLRRWNHTNNTINTTATNHGSSVASLAAATANNGYGGVGMYDGPMRLYQVSADGISFPVTNLYVALDSLIQHCLQYPNQRQINNFSLSAGNDPMIYSRILQLYNMNNNKQNFHQAATGNAGASALDWPARRAECTARGATATSYTKPIRVSSNRGPEMIDHGYVSDGQNVWAMQANGSFAAVNGTSFATPIGTGTVANVIAQDTSRNNAQMRTVLDDGARDLGAVGPDNIYGKGWVELDRGLKIQVVKNMPTSFDANVTPSYNFIPKYYNGVQTTNEKVYINGSPTGISPTTINGMNEAEFNLVFVTTNGFVNGSNTIRYEFNTPDLCITSIYKVFTLSNVSTPTVPPTPNVIDVANKCFSEPNKKGKLMNPPVGANITVTQDLNPLSYNAVDSTFGPYFVSNTTTPGNHNIQVRYQNAAGTSQKDTAYNVAPAVTPAAANPSVSNANICTGQTSTFTANATNVGATPTYKWYINNVEQTGFTSNIFTPPVFNTAGSYNVKYEVTPTVGGCYTNGAPVTSNTVTLTVSQTANPLGDVSPNTTTQCENTSANLVFAFTLHNGVVYAHEQRIINPSNVDNTNGAVVPGSITTPILGPGTWKSYVKSTRQGTNACAPITVYSDTAIITINAQFIADATITGPSQVCDNAAISGVVTPKPGTPNNTVLKLYKQVGAGAPVLFQTSTYNGTPINYNTTGQIPQTSIWSVIELPVGGCYVNANGDTVIVAVNTVITPDATITAPSQVCDGATINGSATMSGGTPTNSTVAFWKKVGTGAPTLFQTSTYTGAPIPYSTPGAIPSVSIWPVITPPAGSCAVPANGDTASIVVNVLPNTPTSTVAQPSCTISTGQITVTNGGAGFTYSFNNGVTWGSSNVSSQLPAGTYQVKTRNASGCESVAQSVTINNGPTVPNTPTSTVAQPSCTISTGQITVTNGGAGFTYSFDNGVTYGTSATSGPLPAGTYQVKVKNASGCESSSSAVIIPSAPNTPVVGNISQAGNILSVAPITGATYQWQFATTAAGPFSNIPNATSTSHTMTQTGYYKVVATNASACSGISSAFNGVLNNANNEIKVYPNPVHDVLTIDNIPLLAKAELVIVDAMGRRVFAKTLTQVNNRATVNIAHLASGVYFISIYDPRFDETLKKGVKIIKH